MYGYGYTNPDGSTDGYSGRGWGEHCDDEPIEPLGGGWRLVRLDDPWIPGGRLWQGPLQRGEDDSFRGYSGKYLVFHYFLDNVVVRCVHCRVEGCPRVGRPLRMILPADLLIPKHARRVHA